MNSKTIILSVSVVVALIVAGYFFYQWINDPKRKVKVLKAEETGRSIKQNKK